MLNSVQLMGRLTREPELKHTQQGVPVCTVGLAIQRDFADSNGVRDADFIDIVFWRHNADFVAKYMHKGQLVAVAGRIRTRYWQDAYDQRRTAVEIEAEHVYFAERTDTSDGTQRSGPGGRGGAREGQQTGLPDRDAKADAATTRRGPQRSDLKPVDTKRADVFPEPEDDGYTGDLYRGGLPRSEFEEYDDDGDVPF